VVGGAASAPRTHPPEPQHAYAVFGGRLRSSLEFPDLDEAAGAAADWSFRIEDGLPPDRGEPAVLGVDQVMPGVSVTLYRHGDGHRLVFDDTGTFDVLDDGRMIRWYADPVAPREAVRLDVLGRVLPLALHLAGTFTLHGSAVRLHDGAVAFLAPKYHGKSTLARALCGAGAALLTDDAVAITGGDPPVVLPGVQRVRLWTDAAVRLGALPAARAPRSGSKDSAAQDSAAQDSAAQDSAAQDSDVQDSDVRGPGEKHLLDGLVPAGAGEVPLRALYLLAPVRPAEADAPVRRTRLLGVEATLGLLVHLKLGPLLGASESSRNLRFCAQLAARVPVYRLHVVRDFAQLDDVVAGIDAWHGGACSRQPA
jgi:hypothetical protein